VTALSPSSTLRPEAAKAEWDRVIRDLRQVGARPRDVSLALYAPRIYFDRVRPFPFKDRIWHPHGYLSCQLSIRLYHRPYS